MCECHSLEHLPLQPLSLLLLEEHLWPMYCGLVPVKQNLPLAPVSIMPCFDPSTGNMNHHLWTGALNSGCTLDSSGELSEAYHYPSPTPDKLCQSQGWDQDQDISVFFHSSPGDFNVWPRSRLTEVNCPRVTFSSRLPEMLILCWEIWVGATAQVPSVWGKWECSSLSGLRLLGSNLCPGSSWPR